MRGWQCYLCKKWNKPYSGSQKTKNGLICQNCKSAEMIREQYLKQYQNKNKWE